MRRICSRPVCVGVALSRYCSVKATQAAGASPTPLASSTQPSTAAAETAQPPGPPPPSASQAGSKTSVDMYIDAKANRKAIDETINVEPVRDLPVFNDLGQNEFELIGFVKPKKVDPVSGKLPCEVPEETAKPPPSAVPITEASSVSKAFKNAPVKPSPGKLAEDEEYRSKIGGFTDSKDVWKKMSKNRDKIIAELSSDSITCTTELEYIRLEQLMKEEDKYHWRIGQLGFDDEDRRNDYYAINVIAMQLNKSRWQAIDLQSQKGKQTTGAAMRSLFWKESCNSIIDKGQMVQGQFIDGHPTLRPFADAVKRRRMTKAFLRGFVDARLKVIPQPANIKQLFDLFDKSYGYMYNALLEVLDVRRNDVAEHIMTHIGRANGLTQHCVLLWREYARRGTTMIPADICADNQVNLGLLKNLHLASVDRCVRRTLMEVMYHVRNELDHVRALAPMCPTKAWPLLLESFLPNYYVNFLESRDFDVTRWFVEQQVMSPGLLWFFYKQMYHWSNTKDLNVLVSDVSPVPMLPAFLQRKQKPRKPKEVPEELIRKATENAQK